MSGVVRCEHCGAPHRRESARTQFRCDWCGGDNRVQVRRLVEELVLVAEDRSLTADVRVREALARRGHRTAKLHPDAPRWAGVWQIVNQRGEEFVAPVRATVRREPVLRTLPVGTLRSTHDSPPSWSAQLPPRPVLDEDQEEVIEAARGSFEDAEAPVTLVRLVWVGIQEFGVLLGPERVRATQLLGTDRVLYDRAPPPPRVGPPVRQRLLGWAAFLAGAILLGLVVPDPLLRLGLVAAWTGLAVALGSVRQHRALGLRS